MSRPHARRSKLLGWLVGCCLAASGLPAHAAEPAIFKASDVHPKDYPTVVAVTNMGRKLEMVTDGRLSIQMFPLMQLGDEKDTVELVRNGSLAMARVSIGSVGAVVDDVNVFNLPFVFRNVAHERKVIDGPVGDELLDRITRHPDSGMVGLCWMDSGSRSVFNSRRPIRQPDDLRGLRLRLMANPIHVATIEALGAGGLVMGMDEIYNAISTGAVDGAENNVPTYVVHNLHTIAPYFSQTEHLILPEVLVFSRKVWDGLAPEDRQLLRRLAREAQFEERGLWDEKEKASMAALASAGVRINPVDDKAAFRAAIKPVWDKYGSRFAGLIAQIEAVR